MKLKRLLASILALAMVLSTMNFTVFADDTTETVVDATYVAQVGDEKFESVLSAITYALEKKESELKLLADSREVMTSDYDFILDADLTITADNPVTAAFYNDGTKLDFAVSANDDYTLTIGENVTFDLEDRVIWLGYYNDNCTVVVNGTLTCSNLWVGTKTVVNSTGKLISDTHEFVMRRDANLVVNGGTVEASYFQIYTGHIEATNGAEIISHGPVNVNGNHSYNTEGDFSISLDDSTFESEGAFNIVASDTWTNGVEITLTNGSTIDTESTFSTTGDVNVSVDATSLVADVNGELDFTPAETTIATVDGNSYTDIQEAIKAAAPSGTVEIVDDIVVDEWVMIAESLTIGNDDLITLVIDGMTINGNGNTLTINSIESAGNGGRMFYDATKLNINDLTIELNNGTNGIGLKSGTLKNVNFVGGGYAILPGAGDITIEGCTFETNSTAIYYEEARDNLVVTGCTFNQPDNVNVILLRGNTTFTNNIVNSGRTVNVVSGSPVVTGNDFNNVRFKVYNEATATIEDNEINVLAFNDDSEVKSTFGENTLSEEAQAVLDAATTPAVPTGSNSFAYTKEVDGYVRVWGEGGGNAKESFVLKLYSEDTLIATTRLNNVDGIIDGDVYVTWNFFYPESNDDYWTTTWEAGHPNAGAQPTKVELYIDGILVSTTDAKMSGADDVNPVVWAELGGVAPEVIEIYDWEDLKELDARVEAGDMLEGVTVKLMNDIDLYEMGTDGEPVSFNPIGANKAYFKGTFDGQGHTIKNMYQSGWALGYDWDNYGTIGLFAYLWNATVKNLTIENAECLVEGGNVAGIAGCAWGDCTFENITIKNSTYATYNNRAAGIVGYTGGEGTMTFKGITVDEDTVIAALWGSYDCTLGGVVGSTHSNNVTKYVFEDVTVACKLDCYNDVTASYKWYSYRMCGMLIGSMKALQEGTTDVDPRDVVTLTNVDITIGEWANQTYIWDDSLSKGCQRVEPGYAYDGVDVSQYPDAEITTQSFNTIIGGPQSQSKGYYGSDITKLEALEDFDTSTLEVEDLAYDARCYVDVYAPSSVAGSTEWVFVDSYDSFADALAAAQDGYMIKFTKDADIGQVAIEGKTVIIDLDAYTVNGAILPSTGDITIRNGTIINTDSAVSAIEINSGVLTLKDVNIDSARHAVRIDGEVEATINGGTYKTTAVAEGKTQHAINVSGAANVTINRGTFTGPKGTAADSGAAVNAQTGSTITINDGTFTGGKNNTLSAGGTIIVYGGTFDQDPTAYVAEGYVANENADGTYSVAGAEEDEEVSDIFGNRAGAIDTEAKDENEQTIGYRLYLFAGIDSLKYQKVGFEVTVDGVTVPIESNKVFLKYQAANILLTPDQFGENTNYIIGQSILFPTKYKDDVAVYRPFAVGLDGTYYYGNYYKNSIYIE